MNETIAVQATIWYVWLLTTLEMFDTRHLYPLYHLKTTI
jgi:hypothetical protein